MPFVVDRHTGKIIRAPEITQEQEDLLWEAIVKGWIRQHRNEFLELCVSAKAMETENGTEHHRNG